MCALDRDANVVTIRLNGTNCDFCGRCSIADLLCSRNIEPGQVVVELNRDIITRDRFAEIGLHHGDEVEVLRFVGGG